MGQQIEYTAQRKKLGAYLAQHGEGNPGILLIHSWWGLNDFFRTLADQLAKQGYTVLAPDLFGGQTAQTLDEAAALRSAKSPVPRATMIAEAARYLAAIAAPGAPVGVIGFSMGAFLALSLAESEPENIAAVVTFYGARNGNYSQTKAGFMTHFASDDPYVTANAVKNLQTAFKKSGRSIEAFTYPNTEHWFAESNRPEYNPEATDAAWERTFAFLRTHLSR